jgi:hypothetical protein
VKGSWDRVAFSNVIADSIPQPCEATVDVWWLYNLHNARLVGSKSNEGNNYYHLNTQTCYYSLRYLTTQNTGNYSPLLCMIASA